MSKIKIAIHSKTVGYSGTDRSAALHAKYLAQDPRYEPFIVYRKQGDNSRLKIMQDMLGADHVLEYDWEPGKKGRSSPYLPERDNLYEVLLGIDPDIVHIHSSGYGEWPGFKYMAPRAKWVQTNIFGFPNKESTLDKVIYISNYIKDMSIKLGNQDGPVLYNPIEKPNLSRLNLSSIVPIRQRLNIPDYSILLGRIGRPDNFDPISLRAFALLERDHPNVYYLVVNPCDGWIEEARRLSLCRVKFLPAIVSDVELSEFYQEIDIYAHARSDGECCPCNIQEAMMHGVPVVSHHSGTYNGQVEIIKDCGFVVPKDNFTAYHDVLEELVKDEAFRKEFGKKGQERAEAEFEASKIVDQLKRIYESN